MNQVGNVPEVVQNIDAEIDHEDMFFTSVMTLSNVNNSSHGPVCYNFNRELC